MQHLATKYYAALAGKKIFLSERKILTAIVYIITTLRYCNFDILTVFC
jgi:hypothetical protein